jgi:uncharacterized membrane protein
MTQLHTDAIAGIESGGGESHPLLPPVGQYEAKQHGERSHPWTEQNVGQLERGVSIASGAILALLGVGRGGLPGLLIGAVGGGLIYRGATGHCHAYQALGINTAEEEQQQSAGTGDIHVEQALLVNKSPEELYRYWRNFANLPSIMSHLKEVTVTDDRKSHWVAKAPKLYGGEVEWDAEITQDEPNSMIAWRSLAGADVDNNGLVRFSPGLGDRGTEVHVSINYSPPAGKVGDLVAKLFGYGASHQIREDLRSFKNTMEVGEVPTTEGQSRGTCTGSGKREGM